MAEETNQPKYGVWLPGKGWVRSGKNNAPYADYNRKIAEELARRLKHGATVYYIDLALFDLEDQLLAAEKEPSAFGYLFQWLKEY